MCKVIGLKAKSGFVPLWASKTVTITIPSAVNTGLEDLPTKTPYILTLTPLNLYILIFKIFIFNFICVIIFIFNLMCMYSIYITPILYTFFLPRFCLSQLDSSDDLSKFIPRRAIALGLSCSSHMRYFFGVRKWSKME